MKKINLFHSILLVLCFPVMLLSDEFSEPETVAINYMLYFFAVEMDKVVKLTHPQTISEFHKSIIQEFNRAKQEGATGEFKAEIDVNLSDEKFEKLSPEDLYILVIGSSNRRAPKEYLEKMKNIDISVIQKELINDSTINITLRYGFPGPNNIGKLILKLYNGVWMVVGNAPN